jgi:hypothetical protein
MPTLHAAPRGDDDPLGYGQTWPPRRRGHPSTPARHRPRGRNVPPDDGTARLPGDRLVVARGESERCPSRSYAASSGRLVRLAGRLHRIALCARSPWCIAPARDSVVEVTPMRVGCAGIVAQSSAGGGAVRELGPGARARGPARCPRRDGMAAVAGHARPEASGGANDGCLSRFQRWVHGVGPGKRRPACPELELQTGLLSRTACYLLATRLPGRRRRPGRARPGVFLPSCSASPSNRSSM